jgi:hypothetical protein
MEMNMELSPNTRKNVIWRNAITNVNKLRKICARFWRVTPKTGLSAPIFFAAKRQKRISASIPRAPRADFGLNLLTVRNYAKNKNFF